MVWTPLKSIKIFPLTSVSYSPYLISQVHLSVTTSFKLILNTYKENYHNSPGFYSWDIQPWNITAWNISLEQMNCLCMGEEWESDKHVALLELCSIILAIPLQFVHTINCLSPYSSEAISTLLTLCIINIIVVNINSEWWQTGCPPYRRRGMFWLSSTGLFAAFVIWSVLLIPA